MSEKIILTAEMIQAAKDYIPVVIKESWVNDCAEKCFNRLSITADGEELPPMYMVNDSLKARYLMAAFVGLYLQEKYVSDEKDPMLMCEEDYDKWAGSHVFNQIERMKREPDVRDKCFDLLYDYRMLEKRFHSAIIGLLTVQNDPVIRQNEMMANQMKALPELLGQLKELQEKVETDAERPIQ